MRFRSSAVPILYLCVILACEARVGVCASLSKTLPALEARSMAVELVTVMGPSRGLRGGVGGICQR